MSDFEQEAAAHGYDITKSNCGCCTYDDSDTEHLFKGYNIAIASMQGEADPVGYVNPVDVVKFEEYQISANKHAKFTEPLFRTSVSSAIYIANQSAEIARLTKELEEARKDAGRWQAICNLWFLCSELKLIQNEDGGYSICEMEFVDNLLLSDFCGNTPEHTIDAAISKIGGGE